MTQPAGKDFSNPETIKAWQCIGCGKLEAPGNCIGVCRDRPVELVSAWDYAEVVDALDQANARIKILEGIAKRLARITPKEGAFEASYLALQREAREVLARAGI